MQKPKYKKQFEDMLANNKVLFDRLKKTNRKTQEFKELQMQVLRIVRRNEDALCKKTESGKYLNFSTGLADKFLEEVRATYPEIDYSTD